jgi:hypothetical protein
MSSIEVTTMPTASAELANKVRIYIGQTTSTYTSGQSYQCIEDPENAGVYIWEPTASKVTVDNVTIQENASGQLETVVKIWNGSSAEWEALSSAEKSKWTVINITDDADDTSTIEARIQALTNSVNTNTGNIADNANDIQTLTNTVNTNSDNIANNNDEYDSNHNYAVGEYCISPDDGTLQKCIVATSGGSWTTVKDTCFVKDSLANAVKTLNSGLSAKIVIAYYHVTTTTGYAIIDLPPGVSFYTHALCVQPLYVGSGAPVGYTVTMQPNQTNKLNCYIRVPSDTTLPPDGSPFEFYLCCIKR